MNTPQLPTKPSGHTSEAIRIAPATAGDAEERDIPVAEIGPEPDQPRKYFDEERDKELEDSIREHGQLNAIIVYLTTVPPRYRLLAGERRWRIFRRLGKATIRARVLKEPPDDGKRRELMLIDNELRQDLTDIERGLAYLDFMTRTGCTASALAQKVGKHVSTVTRNVAIIRKLPDDLREIVGPQLPPSVAQLLTSLPDDDSKRRFATLYTGGQITTGDALAAAIKAAKNGHSASATSGFSCEESGVKFAISWTGNADAQALSNVENALRALLKDLAAQKHRGLTHWRNFLSKKAKAARKAADLAEAQKALANLSNPLPERSNNNA